MICRMCISGVAMAILAASVLPGSSSSQHGEQKKCHIKYQQFENHTMCLPRSPRARTVNMTDDLRQRIVDSHNLHRSKVTPPATNMLKMRWDAEMEEMALRWAEACEFREGLVHDRQRHIPGSMFVGQSMASTTIDLDIAMKHWWFEQNDYIFGKDYQEQLFNGKCGMAVGHYTQMVWAHSYLVGCAATTCDNKNNVIVCNYGPSGNMLPFDHPYEEGPRCSKCKTCIDDGLCDCGELNCHGGRLDPSTCTCDCTFDADKIVPDYIQQPDCSLNCSGSDFKYCGYDVFSNCHDSWTAKKCPHMCKVCPYAEKGYIDTTDTDVSSNTDGTHGPNNNGTIPADGTSTGDGTYATDGTPVSDIADVSNQMS